jgi:hypothetical protein
MPHGQSGPPAVRRHLMTPGQPPPPQRYSMSLTSVQRWVMSTLVAITILHLSAGLVVAAYFVQPQSSKIGLLVISGVFGMLAIEAAVLIHRHRPVTAWVLFGLIPPLVGAWVIFR